MSKGIVEPVFSTLIGSLVMSKGKLETNLRDRKECLLISPTVKSLASYPNPLAIFGVPKTET